MLEGANAIILMKEYPQMNGAVRMAELHSICTGTAVGRVRPVSAVFDCRMLGCYPTTGKPMAGLVRV
jgi:microcystin degradation protein MlrC